VAAEMAAPSAAGAAGVGSSLAAGAAAAGSSVGAADVDILAAADAEFLACGKFAADNPIDLNAN